MEWAFKSRRSSCRSITLRCIAQDNPLSSRQRDVNLGTMRETAKCSFYISSCWMLKPQHERRASVMFIYSAIYCATWLRELLRGARMFQGSRLRGTRKPVVFYAVSCFVRTKFIIFFSRWHLTQLIIMYYIKEWLLKLVCRLKN